VIPNPRQPVRELLFVLKSLERIVIIFAAHRSL
jgi:hypothetical protein